MMDSTIQVPVDADALNVVTVPDANHPNVKGNVLPISVVELSVDCTVVPLHIAIILPALIPVAPLT